MKARIVIFILLLPILSWAEVKNLPSGQWQMKDTFLQTPVSYIFDFQKKTVELSSDGKGTVSNTVIINQNKMKADLGFGLADFEIMKKDNQYFLCGAKNLSDCKQLRLVVETK